MRTKTKAYLKRSIFFFCCLFFGLGNSLDSQEIPFDFFFVYVPIIAKEIPPVKRSVSGYVFYNETGLEDVGIYESGHLLAVTNTQGYYSVLLDFDSVYILTPKKPGYEFTPSSLVIPGDIYAYSNQNFIAATFPTISGKVLWKNHGSYATIPSNPLPMVAVEAYSDDGSLYFRMVTGADGEYSIPVPFGWKGCVKPTRLGFNLFPEKMCYPPLHEDHTQDYYAPGPGDVYSYTIKVILEKMDGTYLPSGTTFDVTLDGIAYAQGSKFYSTALFHGSGELTFTIPAGWIGDITVSHPITPYSFNPPFSRLTQPLNSDMEFIFIIS